MPQSLRNIYPLEIVIHNLLMNSTKQTIIALSTVAAAIVLLACPLGTTHQAQAQVGGCHGHQHDCDVNPPTGNPHPVVPTGTPESNPQGNEVGNPHNSAGCTGDPHGDAGTDVCHGSQ